MDGDNLRHGLNSDLGFLRRRSPREHPPTSEVAALFADSGAIAIVGLISPFASERQRAREIHAERGLPFHEIFLDTPLTGASDGTPRAVRACAARGKIPHFTGIDSPYEALHANIVVTPADGTPTEVAESVLDRLGLGRNR